MKFAMGTRRRTFGLTMFRGEVPCVQNRRDCGPWYGMIYCKTKRIVTSRQRSPTGAPRGACPERERRNTPAADWRCRLGAPLIYGVAYR